VKLNTICRRAGLSLDRDGSYNYYVSEQIVSDSFMGIAPLLLAALEMERLP
jgi:unsaturated rhamnogalacturonyl hydrolase